MTMTHDESWDLAASIMVGQDIRHEGMGKLVDRLLKAMDEDQCAEFARIVRARVPETEEEKRQRTNRRVTRAEDEDMDTLECEDRKFIVEHLRPAFEPAWTLGQDLNEIWSPMPDGIPNIRAMQLIAREAMRVANDATEQVLTYTSWQKFEKVEDDVL